MEMKRRDLGAWPAYAAVLGLGLGLGGCAVTYKPAGIFFNHTGFSSTDVDTTTVDVRFVANISAPLQHVRDLALYRCAEIARERNFVGFVVLGSRSEYSLGQGGIGSSQTVNLRIRLLRGFAAPLSLALQGSWAETYEAAEVLQRLEVKVRR